MKVALTGGMGCGKSFVLSCFEERGWLTVDADAVVRTLWESDADVAVEVRALFGASVSDASGKVDRKAVAARVFPDPDALAALENILLPRVRKAWEKVAEGAGGRHVIVEIPLLFEKNLEKLFDISVCITADGPTQIERLARRGFGKTEALARMARQLPMQNKELRADFVISNNGDSDFTRAQVYQLMDRIVAAN